MINLLRPFMVVGHFFKHLFGEIDGPKLQKVLVTTEKDIKLAQPIVAKLAQVARDLPQDKFVQECEKVIGEYVKDAPKVDAWVTSVEGKDIEHVLWSAARLALEALEPEAKGSVLNFAIETALEILRVV